MMKCIAIDDEPMALNLLGSFIDKIPFLALEGLFESPYEVMQQVNLREIDLLFLDINMPDLSGIDFLKTLPNPPQVIFTTAYHEYALEGFELDAVDYLLKPMPFERFLRAVNKALAIHKSKQLPISSKVMAKSEKPSPKGKDYIFIKSEHQLLKLNLNNILYVEGFKDYLKIFTTTSTQPNLTLKSMKSMEQVLDNKGFVRIHRSFMVSIPQIAAVRGNRVKVGGKYLPIGDNYKSGFSERVLMGHV